MKHLVPPDFVVPLRLEHAHFMLRPLVIADVVRDYDAVMTSIGDLLHLFGPESTWPERTLSLEQDLIDLGWHHKEFQRRTSFAYTVTDRGDAQCLGCAYIYPTRVRGYDAEAYCWMRSSCKADLEEPLYATFRKWLGTEWPFRRVAYPGRELGWELWRSLPVDD